MIVPLDEGHNLQAINALMHQNKALDFDFDGNNHSLQLKDIEKKEKKVIISRTNVNECS
jgi:hypothetical protein